MDEVIKVIDVERAIRNSKSEFVKSLPCFIIRLIQKLVHQDELNATLHKNQHLTGVPFVNAVLEDWNVTVAIKNPENIPQKGRFVFVANHPLGGLDALAFLSTIYRFFPNVVSPSNQLFNYIPNLHPVILGVNVFGINSKETIEKFNLLFESDSQIMIFPAGLVSRRNKGVISDSHWHKTFVTKAIQYNRDVIPVYIAGRNSNLFYSIANMRKRLGIKMSIEIILLPHEMLRQRNSTITLNIGKPLKWDSFTPDKPISEWALHVKEIVYKISSVKH